MTTQKPWSQTGAAFFAGISWLVEELAIIIAQGSDAAA